MAYYGDKIFSNHMVEETAVQQTVFRAGLTMIPVELCGVTCTVMCHTHSDPPASVSVEAADY